MQGESVAAIANPGTKLRLRSRGFGKVRESTRSTARVRRASRLWPPWLEANTSQLCAEPVILSGQQWVRAWKQETRNESSILRPRWALRRGDHGGVCLRGS